MELNTLLGSFICIPERNHCEYHNIILPHCTFISENMKSGRAVRIARMDTLFASETVGIPLFEYVGTWIVQSSIKVRGSTLLYEN